MLDTRSLGSVPTSHLGDKVTKRVACCLTPTVLFQQFKSWFPPHYNRSHRVGCVGEACFSFVRKGYCNPQNNPLVTRCPPASPGTACVIKGRWKKRDVSRCNSEKRADRVKRYVIVFFVVARLFYLEASESWQGSGASVRVSVPWRE